MISTIPELLCFPSGAHTHAHTHTHGHNAVQHSVCVWQFVVWACKHPLSSLGVVVVICRLAHLLPGSELILIYILNLAKLPIEKNSIAFVVILNAGMTGIVVQNPHDSVQIHLYTTLQRFMVSKICIYFPRSVLCY